MRQLVGELSPSIGAALFRQAENQIEKFIVEGYHEVGFLVAHLGQDTLVVPLERSKWLDTNVVVGLLNALLGIKESSQRLLLLFDAYEGVVVRGPKEGLEVAVRKELLIQERHPSARRLAELEIKSLGEELDIDFSE